MKIKLSNVEYEIKPSPYGIFQYSATGAFTFPLFVALTQNEIGSIGMYGIDFTDEPIDDSVGYNNLKIYLTDEIFYDLQLPVFKSLFKYQLKEYELTIDNALSIGKGCADWIIKIMRERGVNVRQKVIDYVNSEGYKELILPNSYNNKL